MAGLLDGIRIVDMTSVLMGPYATQVLADYGATGLFDPVKIGEAELERIYQFDLSLLDDLTHVESEVAALPSPGDQDPGPATDKVLQLVRALEDKWRSREQVISNVVQTSRTL